MRILTSIILITFTFNNLAHAEAVVVKKGEPAPFTGILIDETMAKENEKAYLQLDALRTSVGLYKENSVIMQDQVSYWRTNALETNKELIKKEDRSFYQNLGYFALGCLLTTGLAFAVNKAVK